MSPTAKSPSTAENCRQRPHPGYGDSRRGVQHAKARLGRRWVGVCVYVYIYVYPFVDRQIARDVICKPHGCVCIPRYICRSVCLSVCIYTVERSAWRRKGAAAGVRNRTDRQAGGQANDLRPVAPDAQPETQPEPPTAEPTANCRTEPNRWPRTSAWHSGRRSPAPRPPRRQLPSPRAHAPTQPPVDLPRPSSRPSSRPSGREPAPSGRPLPSGLPGAPSPWLARPHVTSVCRSPLTGPPARLGPLSGVQRLRCEKRAGF